MTTEAFLDKHAVPAVVRAAIAQGELSETSPAALFHDLAHLQLRCQQLHDAFPPGSLHTLAVKANPVRRILQHGVRHGMGLETASLEEVELALAAGCPPQRVVFDSPAKTRAELARAVAVGTSINVDNFDELERLADALTEPPQGRIGVRVNPSVGSGSIDTTSVATARSKFGVPWSDRDSVVDAFRRHPWLSGIHVHAGSQGCGVDLLVEAAVRACALADRIDRELGRRIDTIDIGGGLAVEYRDEDEAVAFSHYAEVLRERLPQLWAPELTVVTEFGRAMLANGGFCVSRVEYVKGDTVVVHVGADLLVRPIYDAANWHHRLAVLDANGHPKSGAGQHYRIAGPLCFGRDFLGEYDLPPIEVGDWLVIRDTGAYTMGMWSRHCSRGMPAMLGYEHTKPEQLRPLRARETPQDIVAFWS